MLMESEMQFCEKVRQLVLECTDEFIADIKPIRLRILGLVAAERRGLASGKPETLQSLTELKTHLQAAIDIVKGCDQRLQVGQTFLEDALSEHFGIPLQKRDEPVGLYRAVDALEGMRHAVEISRSEAEKHIPLKWPKFALRSAAEEVCELLKRHNHYLSASQKGSACELISLLMESAGGPIGIDSCRKAIENYQERERLKKGTSRRAIREFTRSIQDAISGKPFVK